MRTTDFLEEIQRHKEDNIQFYLLNEDGEIVKVLELFVCDGRFIFSTKNEFGKWNNIMTVGLREKDAQAI